MSNARTTAIGIATGRSQPVMRSQCSPRAEPPAAPRGWCAGAGDPAVRQVELAVGDEYVAAVALEEGSAAPGAGVVGHERADGVAEGAEEGGEEQPLEAVAGILDQQPAGQGHDDLAGEGAGGALHGHEEDDAGPTYGVVNGV